MRITFLFILTFLINFNLFGEAPELRNVLPNSWRNLTVLSQVEFNSFILNNSDNLERINRKKIDLVYDFYNPSEYEVRYIYRQTFSNAVFYRVILTNENYTLFPGFTSRFFQAIIMYQNNEYKLLRMVSYGFLAHRLGWSENVVHRYMSLDIIEKDRFALGLMLTMADITVDANIRYVVERNVTPFSDCFYVPFNTMPDTLFDENYDGGYSRLAIYYAYFLVDTNIPLRYSIQNAFDNDVSTSYVFNNNISSNKELDFYIGSLSGSSNIDLSILNFELINGYAQSTSLYQANNRIKNIEFIIGHSQTGKYRRINYELEDNNMSFQRIILDINRISEYYGRFSLVINEIFNGTRYNDTCIAEINLYDWDFMPYVIEYDDNRK